MSPPYSCHSSSRLQASLPPLISVSGDWLSSVNNLSIGDSFVTSSSKPVKYKYIDNAQLKKIEPKREDRIC